MLGWQKSVNLVLPPAARLPTRERVRLIAGLERLATHSRSHEHEYREAISPADTCQHCKPAVFQGFFVFVSGDPIYSDIMETFNSLGPVSL